MTSRRPRQRLPRVHYPKALEAEYAARIVDRLKLVRWASLPLLALFEPSERGDRMDAPSAARAAKLADERLRKATGRVPAEGMAARAGKRVDEYARAGLGRQYAAATGREPPRGMNVPGLNALIDEFAARNAQLITNVTDQAMFSVSMIVQNGVGGAKRVEDIADEIEATLGVSAGRARVIARDQVGKLYGQINAARQQALGIRKFTWRTVGDEAVRPEHAKLDGDVFRWDDPPDDGKFGKVLPGEAIQCRCSGEPVIDLDDDEQPDADEAAA